MLTADWKKVLTHAGPIPSMFRDFQSWMEECFPTPFVRNTFSHITHWHMVLFGAFPPV